MNDKFQIVDSRGNPIEPRNRSDGIGLELLSEFRKELKQIRKEEAARLNNYGFQGLLDGIGAGGGQAWPYGQQTLSSTAPLANSTAYNLVSLNRILLSQSYTSIPLIRRLVNQPVEDAFRGGVKFRSPDLDDDDLALLMRTMEHQRSIADAAKFARSKVSTANWNAGNNYSSSDIEVARKTCQWARLYGGAGIIINTNQDYRLPFDVESIGEDSPLQFIDADRWELILSTINVWDQRTPTPFNYYGLPVNSSRVVKMLWEEAPSFIRLRLQGWGMSVVEDCMRAINAFLKFETLLFELLDEAKIDVYKVTGFNTALASQMGTEAIQRRILMGNQFKNYQSAITMDAEDDYMQKQPNFAGLSEIRRELRTDLCMALRFPNNKLFGESAGGFASGEDSLENYNCIVENVREWSAPMLLTMGELRCKQLFGFIPEDLTLEWKPLRVLDGVQEEEVKDKKAKRVFDMFDRHLVTGQEASEQLKGDGVLVVDSEVLRGERDVEPIAMQQLTADGAESEDAEDLGDGKSVKSSEKKEASN